MTETFIEGLHPAILWAIRIALVLGLLALFYRLGPRRLFQGLRAVLRPILYILGLDNLTRVQRFVAIMWGIRIAFGLGLLVLFFSLMQRISNIPVSTLAQLLFTASIPVVITVVGNRYTQRRAQDEALRAYLDQMSDLLLKEDLRTSKEGSEVRTLARARTSTVLVTLDPGYRGWVIAFLSEAALVQKVDERNPIISLSSVYLVGTRLEETDLNGADLREANLTEAWLRKANLSHADLSEASLDVADLHEADLRHANLREAFVMEANLSKTDLRHANLSKVRLGQAKNLREANLTFATMQEAHLFGADLEGCSLQGVDLSNADLEIAKLRGAYLKGSNLKEANLRGADLAHADLSDTCLEGANLLPYVFLRHRDADLSDVDFSVYDELPTDSQSTRLEDANLSGADLTEADLSGANLRDATGWTEKQLTAAKSLEGAIMPDGHKYEDWLKDKEGGGKDVGNE